MTKRVHRPYTTPRISERKCSRVRHTFLFRRASRSRTDVVADYLARVGQDARLLAGLDCTRGLADTIERLERSGAKRSSREEIASLLRAFIEEENRVLSAAGGVIYPMLAAQLRHQARWAYRAVVDRAAEPSDYGEVLAGMQECMTWVRDGVAVSKHYLDPSQTKIIKRLAELVDEMDSWGQVARVQGMQGGSKRVVRSLYREAGQMIVAYRTILAELDEQEKKDVLLAVFPSGFLLWADSVCDWSKRALTRLARVKVDSRDEQTRASLPMMLLADNPAKEADTEVASAVIASSTERDEPIPIEKTPIVLDIPVKVADAVEEGASIEEVEEGAESADDTEIVPLSTERICAKASDYKQIVAKAIEKTQRQNALSPRPLGTSR